MTPMQALDKAIDLAGSMAELARRVGKIKKNPKVKNSHIWNWRNRDEEVPADMVLAVEEAVAGHAEAPTRHELRPDLYPKEKVA